MHTELSAVHSFKISLSHKEFRVLELSVLEFEQECLIPISFPPYHGHLQAKPVLAKCFLLWLKGRNGACGGSDL